MTNNPNVTAIIPCHNHQDWVNQAIDSVVVQNYPRKRIVVVDDGSTDDSWRNIVSKIYQPKTPQQKLEHLIIFGNIKNSDVSVVACKLDKSYGPSVARNYGIKTAWEGTDIFAFLDSDDYYEQGKIKKSVEVLGLGDAVGAVYSDYDTLNIHNGFRQRQFKESFKYNRLVQECIVNNDSLVKKIALAQCGVYDEDLRVCEDYDLWLRVSEKFVIYHIPESLVTIRVGKHSSTDNVNKATWEQNYRKVFEKMHARKQTK